MQQMSNKKATKAQEFAKRIYFRGRLHGVVSEDLTGPNPLMTIVKLDNSGNPIHKPFNVYGRLLLKGSRK